MEPQPLVDTRGYVPITALPVGAGKQADAEPDALWQEQVLPWHFQGDPLAEQALAALTRHGQGLAAPLVQLRRLAEQGDAACLALLADMEAVPAWVDFSLMAQGGAMAQRNFAALVLSLTYGGMPMTFGHPDAAAIFARTGRMQASISRRLNESAPLFFGIMDTAALAPGGAMWEVCLHVRLVHAMVRVRLLEQGWDVTNRGMPISQLSTAAGPAFFGSHQLTGLRRLGVKISAPEAAGFQLVWRYVTRLLGVPLALLGETQAQQDAFDRQMMQHFFAPDERAKTIMASLIDGLCEQQPTAKIPRALQLALFRFMLGDEMADAFAIPASAGGAPMLAALRAGLWGYSRVARLPGLSGLLQQAGAGALAKVSDHGLVRIAAAGGADG